MTAFQVSPLREDLPFGVRISPWMAEGIEHMEGPEGDALLEEVSRAVIRLCKAGAYVHKWQPTAMLIWDNLRVLHRVTGCTPPQRRSIHRTTIKGDNGLGRFEGDARGGFKQLERTY